MLPLYESCLNGYDIFRGVRPSTLGFLSASPLMKGLMIKGSNGDEGDDKENREVGPEKPKRMIDP